ncbi:hypothetical protein L0337_30250 [candidate division KSB1 bacterium]|nr:hypothetical protein [candidate division KSB1 bacterium]
MKVRVTAPKLLMLLIASALLVSACSKKKQYAPIAEWEKYSDPFFGLSFTHPKGWHLTAEGGRITLTASYEAAERFVDPRAEDKREDDLDIQITVFHERPDSLQPLDEIVNTYTKERSSEGFLVKPTETIIVDSTDARKFSYAGNYTQKTKLSTTRVYMFRDSVQYYLDYSAFDDLFEPYSAIMDTLIASIKLPRPKVKAAGVDESLPSTTFTDFSNNFLKISHPDNFETSFPAVKGDMKFSLELKGYRQDCTVRIDIFPAKGLTVDKVFEQNQSKYARASKGGEVTISGQKALYLNYSPARDIASRAYFLVKDDQVYRIIMNYYTPMRGAFLPVFEQTVKSLKIG